MPSWCNNTITVSGQTETIKNLWEKANREGGGFLSALVPPPELQREEWYEWNVANWGTKWDVSTEGLEFVDNGDGTAVIEGGFDSAWSPPTKAYQTFCYGLDSVYLDAWYEEGGYDFAGRWNSEGVDVCLDDVSVYARRVIENGESGCELYDELDEHFDLTERHRD